MAAISNDKVSALWVEGNADRWGIFRIRNFSVTTTSSDADTWDASNYFATIQTATFLTGVTTGSGSFVSTTSGSVVSLFSTTASTNVSAFLVMRGQASTGYLVGS